MLASIALCGLARNAFADPAGSLFLHGDDPLWISGQLNVIAQGHPAFVAPYTGPNSLRPSPEGAVSYVATLHMMATLLPTTAVLVDAESAGGNGISDALGLGGFTNLDVVRNPTLGPAPYLARALVMQVVPLSDDMVPVERAPMKPFSRLPSTRLTFAAGKISTVDFFDVSSAGSDSHLQFMNWATDNNGAYDYAADTRGYTLGAVVELAAPVGAVRFGEALMPTVANGIDYDWDVLHAHADNLEIEARYGGGVVRGLAYWNHANMGNYAEAIAAARASGTAPAIESTRKPGRDKIGVGVNIEQAVTNTATLFARLGWNDGQNETFAYTEIDDTAEVGVVANGSLWMRAPDRAGIALVTNGLSAGHREYLALGGRGFILGDGALTYGRESIVEAFYTACVWDGVFPAADVQLIENPGYNRDRGPVVVGSIRIHVEL